MAKHTLFFIIGASGSGKTTLANRLSRSVPKNCMLVTFDDIGVPPREKMVEEYGSIEGWQRAMTFKWVEQFAENEQPETNILIDAQVRPAFISEACEYHGAEYQILLIDCSDEERKKRLYQRGDPELASKQMMNWAAYLREVCKLEQHAILDNTHYSIEETYQTFLDWLRYAGSKEKM